tara:strand:- start:345 stop:1187 length:843 start_codon:yes stop_codon:yes gene_type:complete
MTEYADKMKALRQSTTQALDKPKPAYRVMSVDPKGGNIDDQFALIESAQAYGSPASDPSMRKVRVGDSLPEGEVTAITGKGIQVIPDYGDEYVIPLGGRPGYKPPTKTVQAKSPLESVFAAADKMGVDPMTAALLTTKPFKFNPDGTVAEQADKYRIYTAPEEIDREPALWYDEETDTFEPYDQEKHGGKGAVATNTEIYGKHIPGAEDMSADALREASFDAAARQYGQKYENQQPVSESTVEFDGVEYVEEVYDDGAVFFVPTGEDGDYMRGENKRDAK